MVDTKIVEGIKSLTKQDFEDAKALVRSLYNFFEDDESKKHFDEETLLRVEELLSMNNDEVNTVALAMKLK